MSKAMNQYLATYAEQESRELPDFPTLLFDHILVVPCCRETSAFAERLNAGLMTRHKLLVIVVINQPPGSAEPLNQSLRNFFYDLGMLWQSHGMALLRAAQTESCWLVVDRYTDGRCIDPKQGVGLARKIGCDLAAALITRGLCRNSWIYTSDADAHLPENYFMPFAGEGCSAAVFATRHMAADIANENILTATRLYEQALDYYVRGLAWAGSPYAFPTIGSAMAVQIQPYCAARGFPRRAGGEDFYLLNKLAKLGHIKRLDWICVEIEARLSDRVPFGTGPAVAKILALQSPHDFTYYSPEVFFALKSWMAQIPQIWQALQKDEDPLAGLAPPIAMSLADEGVNHLWSHLLQQVNSSTRCMTAVHHWFDGFRTLKFIRHLQETTFPATPLLQSLRTAGFMGNSLL